MKLLSNKSRRAFLPYIMLFAGLLFTAGVCYNLVTVEQAEDQERFRGAVQKIHSATVSNLRSYEALLRATAGLYAASDEVTRQDFKRFIARLDVGDKYSGIQGIGYTARVLPAEKAAFFEAQRKNGRPNFKIWPEYDRDEEYSIVYLEPENERNEVAIGYDMYTDSVRREAMDRARDTGQATASGIVKLVQEIDPNDVQAGFLVYFPVYDNRQETTTVEARRKALRGFVYSPFRAGDLFRSVVAGPEISVDVQAFAVSPTPQNLLHNSAHLKPSLPAEYEPRFSAGTEFNFAGQRWFLTFQSRPGFDLVGNRSLVIYALLGGLLISILFFAVTHSQLRSRATAENAAAVLRQSEATIRNTLLDRERAEDALRDSEERYRELFENANDIVYTLDLNGRLTSINRAGETISGYQREQLLNMDLAELLTPEAVEASREMLERKLGGAERTNYEVEMRTSSGKLVTLEISSRLVSKGGQPIGVQGIARDITVRRRAEEALRQADQIALSEYERLLERIAILSQALGTAHELTAIFRALRDFTLVSAPCDGLFVSLYDPVRNVRTACYGWGDNQEFDVSDLPPMPVTTAGPNSRAVTTGQVIITDDYMQKQRGTNAVIVGPDNGLRPESSMAAPLAVMGRIIGTIEIQSYDKHAYKEEHVTAMRMAANLTAVAIENVRLLERESHARAAAEESNRLKDEFLATVSHELRTPLTAILGWSRMLETGSLDDPAVGRAIETIRRNAKAQAQIVDDILDVSRIITGNLYLDLQPMELAPVIEAAVNVVRPTADAKGIKIDLNFGEKPAVVSGDSNRLQQVIWNLLSNAVKFTPVNGCVTIGLHQEKAGVEITVSDTGPGIEKDFLPYVFDRFRQADSTTTRRHGGLGLGLAIARHLVEIHGGSIFAANNDGQTGSRFTVRLPLIASLVKVREVNGEHAKSLDSQPLLTGLHVLLVDDDVDTLELLQAALTQREAKVTAVASTTEALEALRSSSPDVLVSDIAMPGSDGYELLRKMRSDRNSRFVPAVAITAYAKEEDRQRALDSGFQHYVPKPVELSELITAVAQAAGRN